MLVAQALTVIKPKEEILESVKFCLDFCVTLKSSKTAAQRKQIKVDITIFSWGKGKSITSSIAPEIDNANSDLGNKGAQLSKNSFPSCNSYASTFAPLDDH